MTQKIESGITVTLTDKMPFERRVQIAREVLRLIIWSAFAAILALTFSPVVQTYNKANKALDSINTSLAESAKASKTAADFLQQLSKDYYDPAFPEVGMYWDIKAAVETSVAASQHTDALVVDLDAALLGGTDTKRVEHKGTIPLANSLIASIGAIAEDGRSDLAKLAATTDVSLKYVNEALKPLAGTMANIERLSGDLEREMKEGGPVDKTLAELEKASERFNVLLDDPSIQRALAGVANGTESLAESAKTVDIALRPWRQKVTLLKFIISKAAGILSQGLGTFIGGSALR